MKLVDILAREITEWPQGQPCLWISDAHSATIYGKSGSFEVSFNGDWPCPEDYLSAIVYKAEWQAAADALKAEVHPTESMALRHQEVGRITRQWTGEGLPPVGADVECTFAIEDHKIWRKGVVVHRGFQPEGGEIVVVDAGGITACYRGDGTCLRTFRTPEQIAAEDRDKAIDSMINLVNAGFFDNTRAIYGALYDAGYRKFEIVDN